MNGLVAALVVSVALAGAGKEEHILVRSDHAEILVGKERYRLVTEQAPLRAMVMRSSGKKRVVVNVVRIGEDGDALRGGTPLRVRVGSKRHVFPNRPTLVDKRRVKRLGDNLIASFPVRYPLKLKRGRQVPIHISLRRPKRGGKVGILLTLEDPQNTLLTPLSARGETVASAKPPASDKASERKRRRRRRGRGAAKPEREPKDRAAEDSAAEDSAAEDSAAEDSAAEDSAAEDSAAEDEPKVATATEPKVEKEKEPPAPTAPVNVDAGPSSVTSEPSVQAADAGPLLASAANPSASGSAAEEAVDAGADMQSAPPPAPTSTPYGQLTVVVLDKMGDGFRMDLAEISLDGRPVIGAAGAPSGAKRVLFDGPLRAGEHELQVHLSYGIEANWMFSYLEGYTFHLSDASLIALPQDGQVVVEIVGEQSGGWFTELEDKPALRIRVQRR